MPRLTGPIGYIEHRSPQKDQNGEYIIHPQFVQKGLYDEDKMCNDSQGRCMANRSQFLSVIEARGCSRQMQSLRMPAAAEDVEKAFVQQMCKERGYITVKDFMYHFGVTKYHARKVLDGYCEMPSGWLRAYKEGPMLLYKVRRTE